MVEAALIDPDNVMFDGAGEPRLVASRCRHCGRYSFPRSAICSHCLSDDQEKAALSAEGTLYAYSIVHQAPRHWTVPYALGYVDLPDDVRVLAHIQAPPGQLAIDMPVRLSVGIVGADGDSQPLKSYIFVPVR